ncbi:trypsin Inhibitor like cysteine rich domain protein [Oesophagostomum dentatum]|uniref:Trypsin Inhibitor like cysteine rich domain protein n=1 Tax=Oesophagostomum dentatum TaxID=61180 RepID=A0A0B1STJ6_OESDE|nr:trypsin Inhibitor like cysteine rich domain protein [Oesophagostomum dentatum]
MRKSLGQRPVVVITHPVVYRYSPPVRYVSNYVPSYRPPPQQLPSYACRINQMYVQCIPCERACNNPNWLCYNYCVAGCTCLSGFFRDTITNNCVTYNLCPRLYQQGR